MPADDRNRIDRFGVEDFDDALGYRRSAPRSATTPWSRLHTLTTGVAMAGIAATVAIGAVATADNPGKASGVASANQGDRRAASADGPLAYPIRRHRPICPAAGRQRRPRRRRREKRVRAPPAAADPGADPRLGPRPRLERGILTPPDPGPCQTCADDRSAPADCRPLVPPRGLAHRLRGPPSQGRSRRAVAARRQLRYRARGVVGTARGARAHGRDAVLLDRRARASRRSGTAGRRWAAIRPARDRHAAHRCPGARPVPAARASCSTGSTPASRAGSDGRPTRSRPTARRSASTRASAR